MQTLGMLVFSNMTLYYIRVSFLIHLHSSLLQLADSDHYVICPAESLVQKIYEYRFGSWNMRLHRQASRQAGRQAGRQADVNSAL